MKYDIEQIKGKQNKPVATKYQAYARKFLTHLKDKKMLGSVRQNELKNIGMIIFASKIYDPDELPDTLKIEGTELDTKSEFKALARIKTLEVTGDGDLFLFAPSFQKPPKVQMPETLIVNGAFDANNIKLTMPKTFSVKGDVFFNDCELDMLIPNGINAGRYKSVNFSGTKVKKPITATKFGMIEAWNSVLEFAPNTTVRWNMDLQFSTVTLPENLVVMGNLDLLEATVRFPNKMEVQGDLIATELHDAQLPIHLKVGKSLALDGAQIYKLPDNLVVGDILDLEESKITELPSGLVCGTLIIKGTEINELPSDLVADTVVADTGFKGTKPPGVKKVKIV